MCQRCAEAVDAAVRNGVPEEEAVEFLWNETAFPFAEPTEEQLRELATMRAGDSK